MPASHAKDPRLPRKVMARYNAALLAMLPLGLMALGWRLLRRAEYRPHLSERFGRLAPSPVDRQVIWLHAVSVGEVISAVPLVESVRAHYPDAHLVVSCGTPTGRATASERLDRVADRVIYLAYDLPTLVRSALTAIRPDLMLLVETEIWPNLLAGLARRKVPVLLVNGRISHRSFPRYLRFKSLIGVALSDVRGMLMQTARDASRIRHIGANRDRISVVGNIKYDQPFTPLSDERRSALTEALAIDPEAPVLVAGSTHEEEELALVEVWQTLRQTVPDLVLVLGVRHPNRADEVVRGLAGRGVSVGRKTVGDCAGKDVVMLDTVGELADHYQLATVAFVGGSLVPIGGHNPLEPAAAGIPVLYGPYVHNFAGPCKALEKAGAAVLTVNQEALQHVLAELLSDPDKRQAMGEAGRQVVHANQGAIERVVRAMTVALPPDSRPGP